MRLLIYGLNYAPELTGVGKYTGEMAAWLSAHGHEVEMICGLPHYPRWRLDAAYADGHSRVEVLAGVRVLRAAHFVPDAASLGARARIRLETSFTLSAARYWLPRFFARTRPDAVIAVMPPMQMGVWPLLYGWLRRVPWVLHVQDLQVDAALQLKMLPGGVVGKLLYRIEAFLLKRAARVSTITEAMRQRVMAKGVRLERAWLFPNWADITSVRPGSHDNAFRAELGFGPETVLVLYAGNMGEKQGLDCVLEAAVQLQDRDDIRFLMVGAGPARARLEQCAQELELENLRFLPVQPMDRLSAMLAAGDIHLVVQRRDAADLVMPSKLTNILAAGRPCVATAEVGTALAEVVAGHETGRVTPPEDSAALAHAIAALAEDAALRTRYGKNARDFAECHLDREVILAEFERQLETLVRP